MVDILVVEDNKELAVLLCDFLRAEGYVVSVANTGEKALELFNKYGAQMLLLDIMLPGTDGFAVCSEIRKDNNVPILILSAKSDKDDKLKGINIGADDYIDKPFDMDILIAKIKGIFKRMYGKDEICDGDLLINKINKTVYRNNLLLDMTLKEYELLLMLVENKGKVLKKEYLFNKIWGYDSFSEMQTLTVHIKWLREKIEINPKEPERILTVWGVGYKFI